MPTGRQPAAPSILIRKENHMDYVYLDFEFLPDDFRPEAMLSVGIVTEYAAYYAVNAQMDWEAAFVTHKNAAWMSDNVFKHYPSHGKHRLDHGHEDVKPYKQIGQEVDAFFKAACPTGHAKTDIEVVVNCGAQDMIRLHGLICGHDWSKMSSWIPQGQDDMYRIKRKAYRLGVAKEDLPVQDPVTEHHALYDAEYERSVHEYIMSRLGDV